MNLKLMGLGAVGHDYEIEERSERRVEVGMLYG